MTSEAHDEYIENAPDFAKPILRKIQKAMRASSEDLEETIKWRVPHYEYHGMIAGLSAHKSHIRFGFWRGKQMSDPEGLLEIMGKTEIGLIQMETVADVPPQRVLVRYVREAMRLNEAAKAAPKTGTRKRAAARKKSLAARTIAIPKDLTAALKKNRKARATFEGFSYTNRREYVEWLTEAKREATRQKRLEQAVEWMAEGKPRNWKYMPKWRD